MTFDPAAAQTELLRALGLGGGPGVDPVLGPIQLSVAGVGWATVELERAATALESSRRWRVEPAQPDTLLGATARIGHAAGSGLLAVLLEPFTEGRLAAFLARHGEAPAVLYVAPRAGGLAAAERDLAAAGLRTRSGEGPLGAAALVLGRSADEPQLVLVGVPSGP